MRLPPWVLEPICLRAQEECGECGSALLDLNFKKGLVPPSLGVAEGTEYRGCPVCDEKLLALGEAKRGKVMVRRFGGGGRGRGRGGRGRGKREDPRMSFRDF